MRAVIITDDHRLTVEERPDPEPGPGQVLVRVHGAGCNRADLVQVQGGYPAPPGSPPDIPGLEFAGEIAALGDGVAQWAVGDRVFGIAGGGGQAELITVPAAHCVRVPAALDLVAAGGVPEVFVTAHDALVTQAQTNAGEVVLIHAVGSGVGTAGLQLAKAIGATVVGTARTADKLDRCRGLGMDHGVVAPRPSGATGLDPVAFAEQVTATVGGPVDVVLELVGGEYVATDVRAAGLKGRIVVIGAMAGGRCDLEVALLMVKRLRMMGTVLRSRPLDEKTAATEAFARDVVPMLDAGTVAPVVAATYPLAEAAAAYELLASDATFGKVVLDLSR
jgi:putative PIG3 family NAD(P)H quinone oxidoreductase